MAEHKKTHETTADKGSEKANIPPAKTFSPSGAPHQTAGIDIDHPAVDNDPRKDSTLDQNRIDFNDPGLSEEEAVTENLKKQG